MARAGSVRCAPLWLALAAFLSSATHARVAVAQVDDWQVQRNPFDKTVITRYKAILTKQPHDPGALAKLLEMYRRYRTVAVLESEYRAILAKKANDWSSLVVLAKIRHSSGDDDAAIDLLQQATTARADDAAAWLLLGELRKATAKGEARTAYENALTQSSNKSTRSRALRALADLALASGDIDAADRHFRRFLEIDPKNAQLWTEHGDAMVAAKRGSDAIASYAAAEKLLAADPARRVEVVARRGQALEAIGRDEEAKVEYRRAITLAPRGYYIEVELTARIIDIYRRRQELSTLLAEYEKQWPERGRNHFEWDTLGKLYEETGSQDKAITALKNAAAKAPWELETQRRLIQLLENSARDSEALAQFEAVVRVAPGEARFQIDLIDRYWRRGLEKKALDGLRRLESRFPGDAGILSAIADLYQRYGKEDLALAAYERLAKIEPDDPTHLVTLGEQYFQKGDKAKALATWKRIANGKNAAAFAKLGEVMAEHNMPGEALANYEKALKLEPRNPDLYKGRAAIQEARKEYAEALSDWEEVLRLLDPKDRATRREVRRRLVQALLRTQGRELEYRGRWTRAFDKKPADPEAGYFLIEYYGKRPRAGEPQRTLVAMRSLVPDDQELMSDLVKSYRALRNYDAAVAVLLDIAKIAPNREAEIFNSIAEIKSEARQDGEAKEWAQKALAKSPNTPGAYQRMAELNVAMQRRDEAIVAYEKVIQLDPRNTKSFFALAELYVQGAQPEKAVELYRRLLRGAPDEEILARAGRKAIDLEEMTGTLGELERTLAPLAFMMSHKAAYRRVLVDLYLRYVPALVERGHHGSEDVKQAAQLELTRIGEHGLRPLLEALRDEQDITQRKVAVSVLGHLGNKGAALPLVNLARQEPKVDATAPRRPGILAQGIEWDLRIDALIAAGRLGDASILAEVIPLLSHNEAAMREAATFTIGRTGDRRAIPNLVKALSDRRDSVQTLACLGLAQVVDAKSVPSAVAVVADGNRNDSVRAACAYALGIQRVASSSPALSTAVTDNRGRASRLAAWALGQIGDHRATPDLLHAYFGRAQPDGSELLWAIARVGAAGLSPSTVVNLQDYPVRADRFDSVQRMTTLPGPLPVVPIPEAFLLGYETQIGDALLAALAEHRDVALNALSDLNSASDRHIALRGVAPASPSDRAAAALDRIGVRIVPALERLLIRDDAETRAEAILVLAKAAAPSSPQLEQKLAIGFRDKSPLVRGRAMQAVAIVSQRLGHSPPLLVRLLREALLRTSWQDRRIAALALGQLNPDLSVGALAAAAGDPSGLVREAVAQALGRGAPGAIEPLILLSADPVSSVRAAAAAGLAQQRDERARKRLRELASDPSPEVRSATQ